MSTGEVPIVRSIVAVGAGFFTVMVLGAAADVVFGRMSPDAFDPSGQARAESALFIKLAYETAFALLAGYITARISSQQRPFTHAIVMAALVLAGRAVIAIAAWDVTPPWFNLGVLLLIIPAAWLGAKLSELRAKSV
jgi:hypothetical protein